MIKVLHNDATVEVDEGLNIWKFLEARGVKHPKWIVFELNCALVPQEKWDSTTIVEDDEVETAYLSGGG